MDDGAQKGGARAAAGGHGKAAPKRSSTSSPRGKAFKDLRDKITGLESQIESEKETRSEAVEQALRAQKDEHNEAMEQALCDLRSELDEEGKRAMALLDDSLRRSLSLQLRRVQDDLQREQTSHMKTKQLFAS